MAFFSRTDLTKSFSVFSFQFSDTISRLRRLCGLTAVWAILFSFATTSFADDQQIDQKTLRQVKRATVQLRVKLSNDTVMEGSGWFAFEPGLVITNAHVLGMIDGDSRRPQLIEVVIHSGEKESKTVPAKFLGMDGNDDLAVLKVEGDDLPEPLALGSTSDLIETQPVFIFGFPFGKQLGKNITVSKSSISSLRKNDDGSLKEIQVNGGMHPGNSGGPVVAADGQVIGVSVSVITGTQINNAIPSDKVKDFLLGRVTSISVSHSYRVSDKTKVPVRLVLNDPLNRVKDIKVDYWVAPTAKNRIRPGGLEQPQPLPGDSPITTSTFEYNGRGVANIEVDADPLTDPKMSYWFRPVWVNGEGTTVWYRTVGNLRPNPVERKETTLKFEPKVGKSPQVEIVGDSSFQLRVASQKPNTMTMQLKVTMNPTIVRPESSNVDVENPFKMGLSYSSFTIGMKENGEVVKNDARWKSVGQNVLKTSAIVDFDDDGSVDRVQTNLQNASKEEQPMIEGITENLLQALDIFYIPLPKDPIKPNTVIKAKRDVSVGLPGMSVTGQAVLRYQYLGMRTVLNSKPTALFEVSGKIRGRRGDGVNLAGGVSGQLDVLLETGVVVLGNTNIKTDLDIGTGATSVRLTGTLAMQIHPAPPPKTNAKPAKPGTPSPKPVDPGLAVEAESPLEVGARLLGEWKDKWLPVKVLAVNDDGNVRVHWEGYADNFDEDLPRARLRFLKEE